MKVPDLSSVQEKRSPFLTRWRNIVHYWSQETIFDLDEGARLIFRSGEEEAVVYSVAKDLYTVCHQALLRAPQPIQALRANVSILGKTDSQGIS